jgi:glucose-6-phosphate isomerase
MAESIGKEHNKNGDQVLAGITPTVSLGSVDLHSVAQLYLGGPRDKFTTFLTVSKSNQTVIIPDMPEFKNQFPDFNNKTFSSIMDALVKGTQTAYLKNNRPFCSVVVPQKNEFFIGQFLQFKMMEIMYLGFLLHVDPFDQPNVELYKRETRTILGM